MKSMLIIKGNPNSLTMETNAPTKKQPQQVRGVAVKAGAIIRN
jgi:hypothetical protein